MIMKGFCEKKFSSMLISGTFTKAVMYLMLLSDSIIAGFFIGSSGVAGIRVRSARACDRPDSYTRDCCADVFCYKTS